MMAPAPCALGLLAILTLITSSVQAIRTCDLPIVQGTTVIFVADPGGFSGTAEAAYYVNNLKDKRRLPQGAAACPDGYLGKIMRQNVAVITTGIGPTAAALCVFDVVSHCGSRIKDVFYSGTSGFSAQLGGVINNGTCELEQANTNTADIVRAGDVCVSPFSVNWDCRKASWTATGSGNPNECTFPAQMFGPADSDLFGQCQFTDVTKAELMLSDEVLAAAAVRANKLPTRNSIIQALDVSYWRDMAQGTNLAYPVNPTAPPRIWTYKECMEIDSQYFWSGAAWDMVARAYVADTLNKGLGLNNYTQSNVIAVSAMEAIGLSAAMQRYNSLRSSRGRRIPYTVVRSMSNWVQTPLMRAGNVWLAAQFDENLSEGYKYAISTASGVVLSTLQARCEKLARMTSNAEDVTAMGRPRPTDCTYTINYN